MVAEPFIFLSEDRQVDIRCCVTKGMHLFCVQDFIRRTANRRLGPLDAVQLWMHISSALKNENDIVNSFLYRFPGPYEKPNVCVNANGLLMLYYQMDVMHGLVNEKYRAEVNERLLHVVSGLGERYMEEHDDGEIDAQTVEEGGCGLVEPPEGSRFWYVPVMEEGAAYGAIAAEVALGVAEREKGELGTRLARAEEENRRMLDQMDFLNKRVAELEEGRGLANVEEKKVGGAFTLSSLVVKKGLEVVETLKCKLFKRVVAKFKSEFPSVKLRKNHHVVYFSAEYRDDVERVLQSEFLSMELERVGGECWIK